MLPGLQAKAAGRASGTVLQNAPICQRFVHKYGRTRGRSGIDTNVAGSSIQMFAKFNLTTWPTRDEALTPNGPSAIFLTDPKDGKPEGRRDEMGEAKSRKEVTETCNRALYVTKNLLNRDLWRKFDRDVALEIENTEGPARNSPASRIFGIARRIVTRRFEKAERVSKQQSYRREQFIATSRHRPK